MATIEHDWRDLPEPPRQPDDPGVEEPSAAPMASPPIELRKGARYRTRGGKETSRLRQEAHGNPFLFWGSVKGGPGHAGWHDDGRNYSIVDPKPHLDLVAEIEPPTPDQMGTEDTSAEAFAWLDATGQVTVKARYITKIGRGNDHLARSLALARRIKNALANCDEDGTPLAWPSRATMAMVFIGGLISGAIGAAVLLTGVEWVR